MNLSSYVVTHDYGFAPNPFGGVLTLATCKPKIRKYARVGDWIMGTGSSSNIGNGKLIFAAEIFEVLSIEEYGTSKTYKFKIPTNGPEKWSRRGDNIYYKNNVGEWIQRKNPFHGPSEMKNDLEGQNVLICKQYWYFGASAPKIPSQFLAVVKKGPGHKHNQGNLRVPAFLEWLKSFEVGLHGQPSSIKA